MIQIPKKIIFLTFCFLTGCDSPGNKKLNQDPESIDNPTFKRLEYHVYPLEESIEVNADWEKSPWTSIQAINIENQMGDDPKFRPRTEVKMAYNADNIFVIFKVDDRFVRSVIEEANGPVYGDACVEFFFAPDALQPLKYFNLEVNCGGTPLMHYVTKPREEFYKLKSNELDQLEIVHSMPDVVDPEMVEPVTWTLAYRIPLVMLEGIVKIDRPGPGVSWRANFYKTANTNSNPHYFTWSPVEFPKPNFHLPEYFGTIVFH